MDTFQILMKKRIIQRSKRFKNKMQGTFNFSTTSNSNKIYPSFPSTMNNKNSNYEEQLKKFEEYSKYHFISKNQNEKSELSLLKNGINSIINNNNNNNKSNYYIKLSPIKKKEISQCNSPQTNQTNRINKKINLRNILLRNNYNNSNNNTSIWEKLKNSESMKESYKYSRSNIRESIKKYEYMERQRDINKIKVKCDIEKEQINKINKLYKSEKNFLEKMKKKLKKSYENVKNTYENCSNSQSNFIFTTAIKERNENDQLIIDKKNLKKEIILLENNINNLIEKKNYILNWVLLLIKIKENKKILPKYYIDIVDKNFSFDSLIKKYNNLTISKEEYNKIKSYKNNLAFDDIDEFSEELNAINNKIIIVLKERNKLSENKNKTGKFILDEMRGDMKPNEEENKLRKELKVLKNRYIKLKEIYNNTIYYTKKRKKKSNRKLFLFTIKLFEEFKKLKFSKSEIIINFLNKEEKIIMDIIEYFEINLNYLLLEKNKYNSNEELKEIYKNVENKIKKEKIYINFIKQQKINKKLLEDKQEKIQRRLNRINYSLNKKADFDNYLREKSRLNKTVKKEEDEDEINRQFILYS